MTKNSREKREEFNKAILAAAQGPSTAQRRVVPLPSAMGPVAEAARNHEESLRAQLRRYENMISDGHTVLRLDPKSVAPSRFKNRDPRSLDPQDPELIEIRESIRAKGQDTPITVFRLKDYPRKSADPGTFNFEFEIAVGRRRVAACAQLDAEFAEGFPVLAYVITPEDDRALTQLIHRENHLRKDLSPIEYGRMYVDWLEQGLYSNYAEIAAAVGGKDDTAIGRYVRISELQPFVLAAFDDPRTIRVRWGDELHKAVNRNAQAVESMAAQICAMPQRPEPAQIFEALTNPDSAPPVPATKADGAPRKRRSHALREQSVRVGGRVPLKIGFSKHRVVLRTLHLTEDQEKRFADGITEHAERLLRELMGDESAGGPESKPE